MNKSLGTCGFDFIGNVNPVGTKAYSDRSNLVTATKLPDDEIGDCLTDSQGQLIEPAADPTKIYLMMKNGQK